MQKLFYEIEKLKTVRYSIDCATYYNSFAVNTNYNKNSELESIKM